MARMLMALLVVASAGVSAGQRDNLVIRDAGVDVFRLSVVQVAAVDSLLLVDGLKPTDANRWKVVQRIVDERLAPLVKREREARDDERVKAIEGLPDRAAKCKQAEAVLGKAIPGCGQ